MFKVYEKLKTSLILHYIFVFFTGISSVFKKSLFFKNLISPDKINKRYEESLFCGCFTYINSVILRIISFFIKLFGQSFFGELIKKSFFFKYVNFGTIVSFFLVLMLLIPHEYWNNAYGVVIAVGLFLAYLVKCAKNGEKSSGGSLWFAVFIISVCGAIVITPSLSEGLRVGMFIFSALIFFYIIKEGITDKKSLSILIYSLITGLFLICLYAIYQMFSGVDAQELLTDISMNKGMPGRVYSTLENPNNFAEVIVLLIPFAAAMFFISKNKYIRLLLCGVAVTAVAALLMSYSRGCYVSFAISVFVFILLYRPKWLVGLFFLAFLMIPFMPESVMNRILTIGSTRDTSNAFRLFLWDGVFKLIRDEGITGIGLGAQTFIKAYMPYAHRFAAVAPHSHMLYLELFIEFGVVGGLSFFAFMYSSLRKGIKAILEEKNELGLIIIAAISAFSGIAFSAATEYIWFYPRVMFVFFIVLGILLAAVKQKENEK